MTDIKVVVWSGSGNTQAMADAVAEGIRAAGGSASVIGYGDITPDALVASDRFALGCPAMGAEVLEESEVEPFVAELEGKTAGKKIALFGSYGWGDGEWMRNWVGRMQDHGAIVVNGEGVMANNTPDDAALEECRNLGRDLVKA